MTKEKRALIEYRMERARETLGEAKMMFDAERINAYVNRILCLLLCCLGVTYNTKFFNKQAQLSSLIDASRVC